MIEEEDPAGNANYYGIWPTVIGIAFGIAIMVFMFALADGFTG